MSVPHGVACRGCYYFQGRDAHNDDAGFCRRFPPTRPPDLGRWPLVQPDDWCGEFRHQADWPEHLRPSQRTPPIKLHPVVATATMEVIPTPP